jgi:hypothetical protein
MDQGRVLVHKRPARVFRGAACRLARHYVAMLPRVALVSIRADAASTRSRGRGDSPGSRSEPGQRRVSFDCRMIGHWNSRRVDAGSGPQLRFGGTRLPGEYVLLVPADKGKTAETRFLVQRNPEESRPGRFDGSRQGAGFAQRMLSRSAEKFDISTSNARLDVPKHPVEGWLLGALAFILLGEMALAGWMTQTTAPATQTRGNAGLTRDFECLLKPRRQPTSASIRFCRSG